MNIKQLLMKLKQLAPKLEKLLERQSAGPRHSLTGLYIDRKLFDRLSQLEPSYSRTLILKVQP